MPEEQCFIPKGDIHLLKNVTQPRRHESENEDLCVFCSLLTKKAVR